ncbi:hypothetical protein AJ79_07793 [Helicocarpus griseus UAMH5409]|uniref:Uncharacterized protein n=1 Tax=Helicocarpus griseus UAMH5409 TaxID=1447875 RepID=A0A2B7WZ61_9EURO|nr:hypothetical protein AJ79_07793 [Helicocarpus griseus UAMH5409]
MAIWPFGRRGKRARKQEEETTSGAATADPLVLSRGIALQPNNQSHGSVSGSGKATRRDSKRRKRDNISVPSDNLHDGTVRLTNLPPGVSTIASARFHRQPASVDTSLSRNFAPSATYHYTGSLSQTSLGHTPTLHGRRSTEPGVVRRKSSKRKRDDYAREREIKNMSSSPVTVQRRPSTVSPTPQWWESRRGMRNAKVEHAQTSHVSLPQDTGRSSPFDIGPCSFKVGAFGALTPRPILRYAEPSRYIIESRDQSRASDNKERRQIIPAEELTRVTYIKELADDMDASALRELMERDRRRKEMKRLADQQKLQRKLQRRADRQRELERRNPPPPPSQLATAGDGVEHPTSSGVAVTAIDRQYAESGDVVKAPTPSGSWLQDPSKESLHGSGSSSKGQKLSKDNSGRPSNASQDINMSGTHEQHSVAPNSHDTGDIGISLGAKTSHGSIPDIPQNIDAEKRHSDSTGKLSTSWTTFFRRGGSRFRRANPEQTKAPSEFSIPSRESFQRINQQPPPTQPIPIPERSYLRPGTTFPRSHSKFTEHFTDHVNEFPMPPGRELQSSSAPHPEMAVARPTTRKNASGSAANEQYRVSRGSAVATPELRDDYRSSGANSPDPNRLATSLASIDSEGSWISGLMPKRLSPTRNSGSAGSTKERLDEYDEYRDDRLLGAEGDKLESSRSVHKPRNADFPDVPQESLEEGTLHASVGKRALVVSPESRPYSNDGIVNEDSYMERSGANSPDSPIDGDSEVRRATSIDLGNKQHVRHISAGSAKLLDISRRASEAKRLSTGSNGSAPMLSEPTTKTQPAFF